MTTEVPRNELRALYRELILEHAPNPRHCGELSQATHRGAGANPLCGDNLELFLDVDHGTIDSIGFTGTGCAISVASASLLTETVNGMHSEQALALSDLLIAHLCEATETPMRKAPADLGALRALEGVAEFPSRVKCATLAWHALRSAITIDNDNHDGSNTVTVSTE